MEGGPDTFRAQEQDLGPLLATSEACLPWTSCAIHIFEVASLELIAKKKGGCFQSNILETWLKNYPGGGLFLLKLGQMLT